MKLILLSIALFACIVSNAQLLSEGDDYSLPNTPALSQNLLPEQSTGDKIKLQPLKWRMTGNRWLTGGLVFIAGASKGFNETLQFHWSYFRKKFPNANPLWFNPAVSWKNKYKNHDRSQGPRFPLSTSVFVAFTDQYHLNTFINRMAWTSTLVIKIGEGKKPFKHYLFDALYYTACHQAGFALMYYPFTPQNND
ncbi:MAG TPA: hypothetical protein VF476_15430 [Chitinophagaceae bacterium]